MKLNDGFVTKTCASEVLKAVDRAKTILSHSHTLFDRLCEFAGAAKFVLDGTQLPRSFLVKRRRTFETAARKYQETHGDDPALADVLEITRQCVEDIKHLPESDPPSSIHTAQSTEGATAREHREEEPDTLVDPTILQIDHKRVFFASRRMQEAWQRVHMLADTDLPLLLHGGTGSGKGWMAHAAHEQSPSRRSKKYLELSCAVYHKDVLANELFGHRKGAYTGADKNEPGAFQAAEDGTLFLDEIGELGPEGQAMLLKIFDEGQFHPLGGMGQEPMKVQCRLIFATNRDLRNLVKAGTFREDLFYRIRKFPVRVPSLRERADRRQLIEFLLTLLPTREIGWVRYAHPDRPPGPPASLSEAAWQKLMAYEFPGNVRELEDMLEGAYEPQTEGNPEHVTIDVHHLQSYFE